eukprot:TRINITY_DN434_c0_g1_i8.p1 TRINITY_DN434_c0_g1~~TRINITY_DN434_c0_g1_i8.p1  ORF type:complete len:191 (-),score=6.83 TRINITY_DN434_c0_g1_i8:53-625(-)
MEMEKTTTPSACANKLTELSARQEKEDPFYKHEVRLATWVRPFKPVQKEPTLTTCGVPPSPSCHPPLSASHNILHLPRKRKHPRAPSEFLPHRGPCSESESPHTIASASHTIHSKYTIIHNGKFCVESVARRCGMRQKAQVCTSLNIEILTAQDLLLLTPASQHCHRGETAPVPPWKNTLPCPCTSKTKK